MPIALGVGAVGAAGAIASGYMSSNAANRAADLQAQTGRETLALQSSLADRQYGLTREAFNQGQVGLGIGQAAGERALGIGQGAGREAAGWYSPYIQTGTNAFNSLAQLYGVPTPGNPGGGSAAINKGWSDFLNTPAYQFAVQQGNLGLDRTAASKGLLLSGGQLKDAMSFNQGLASQQIGNYTNVLSQMGQMGLSATQGASNAYLSGTNAGLSGFMGGTSAGLGSLSAGIGSLNQGAVNTGNMANTLGGTNQAIGQSAASGPVGAANAWSGAINSGTSNALLAYGLGSGKFGGNTANAGNTNFNPSSYQPPGLQSQNYWGAGYPGGGS